MKKTAIALALAGFATLAQAAPQDDTWYIGGKLGWSQYHDTSFYGNGFDNCIGNGPTCDDQLGAGAFIGHQANQYLGFELGYDWLGRIAYKGSMNSGTFKAQGISIASKLSYQLTDDIDIYTRLGGMVWRTDSKVDYDNGNADHVSSHDAGVSPLAAVGFEYAWTKNWATRLDYQWINNIGNAGIVGTRPDNSVLSVNVSYRFGQNEDKVASPSPTPVIETKRFTLKSGVLFNFDETTLKPEAQQELDQLYSQLSSIEPKDGSVIVLGYTDRIGSDIYNQKLSQARAQSVVSYLVSKGILSEKISAHGMGKSNSVTGSTCNNVKGRAPVIKCLAPDRRVEIEVKGIKDIVTPQPTA